MKKISICVLIILAFSCILACKNTNAIKCSSSNMTKSYNSSIYNACKTMASDSNGSGDWWGALWINGSSDKYALGDEVSSVQISGKLKIYLHGLAICDKNSSGCGNKYCGYIKILNQAKEYPNGSDIGWKAYRKLENWAPLSNIPSSLTRPSFGKNQTLYSVAKAMVLDIDKMKSLHSPSKTTAQYRTYNIMLQGYRVGDSNDPSTGGSSQRSDLNISIPQEYTLTAYAAADYREVNKQAQVRYLTSNGSITGWKTSPPNNAYKVKKTVAYGKSAATTLPASLGNYVWKEWGGSCKTSERNGRKCTKNPLKSNTSVNGYYKLKTQTLTAYAVTAIRNSDGAHKFLTTDGTETGWRTSPPDNVYKKRVTSDYGKSAAVAMPASLGNFVWKSWGSSCKANEQNGRTCTRNPLNSDGTVYAYYKPSDLFQGKSLITGTNYNTGYTKDTKDAGRYFINNCSSVNGCKVTFEHWMKRDGGTSSTSYKVTRASNYDKKGVTSGQIGSGTFNTGEKKVASDTVTMYPGQVVCEALTFDNNGSLAGGSGIVTKVCAAALGDAQPPDPNPEQPPDETPNQGNSAFLSIRVKNPSAALQYRNYQETVYAKPGDTLTYRAVYNPILQYTYYIIPERMRIDGGTIYPASGFNTSSFLFQMFNNYRNSGSNNGKGLLNWNNSFSVNSDNFKSNSFSKDYKYTLGNIDIRNETNNHTVLTSEVGSSLDEIARTQLNNNTKTTPGQVRFVNNDGFDLGNVITIGKTDTAYAKVPYNFINSTRITSNPDTKTLYAGEKGSIDFSITTSPRNNNVTNGTYATIVKGGKYKLQLSYTDPSSGATRTFDTAEVTKNLNEAGMSGGYTDYFTSLRTNALSFNVPDLPAGSEICVKSMVWPIDSGAATNIDSSKYTDAWAESNRLCFKIAKKPSIALWGGNTLIAGKVSTATSVKNNLAGRADAPYNINPANNPKNYIFGSWTELGLIAGGQVNGLASGASTGVAGIDGNGLLTPTLTYRGGRDKTANYSGNGNNGRNINPGGITSNGSANFCSRSILTFANNNCNGGSVGNVGSSNSFTNASEDRNNIISRLEVNDNEKETKHKVENGFSINDESKRTSNGSFYYYNSGDLAFNGGIINQSTTQMIHASGTITIAGDIRLEETGYKTLNQLPKLILYAEKDVMINCDVERIDALIIAGQKVVTCDGPKKDGKYDINRKEYSAQLIINGAIIAGSLTANRTYGASTGNNSIIPAEIINFDPSLYLWSSNNNESQGTTNADSNLETTFITEVAPRY